MNNYKLLIQYDGGRYKGWQRLGGGENTIQGKIENVLSEMLGEPVEIIGSSRTDAGVHALAQVANFKTKKNLEPNEVQRYLNKYLPHDISVKEVQRVPERFHSRYNAKAKTYLYKIWNEEYANPFMRKYSTHIDKRMDLDKMREGANHFIGEHDFTAFSNAKSKSKSMVREIYSIQIDKSDGFVYVSLHGNGFLYNMVRRIVGMLIEVSLGNEAPQIIPKTLASHQRKSAAYMADACGLHLNKVVY